MVPRHPSVRGGRYLALLGLAIGCVAFAALLSSGCLGSQYHPPDGTGKVLVDYHRSGGIAAFDDRLTIYENGTLTYSRRSGTGSGSIDAEELIRLNELFEQARFLELQHLYPAPAPGADYFTYSISYRGYTVETEDTGVPEQLTPILQRLNELLTEQCGVGSVCPAV